MARSDTQRCPETARTVSREEPDATRTLVVIDGSERAGRKAAAAIGRPRAEFLTQLIISADPTMRASRAERMRSATARYGEATKRRA